MIVSCFLLSLFRPILSDEVDPISYLQSQLNRPSYESHSAWATRKKLPNHAHLVQAATDTFAYIESQSLLPDFKNPCWRETTGSQNILKCMPYFQILGVSKCGTTDLYHRLSEASEDLVDCGWKGPHFWDESVFPISAHRATDKRYNGSFPAYVSIFDRAALRIAEEPLWRITGEASSNTFTGVYSFVRGMTWPRKLNVTLSQYVYSAAPWSRFLVMFRDPVDRYQSAFYYYRTKKDGIATPDDLHRRAVADIAEWESCLRREKEELKCLRLYNPQQLVKGMYGAFVEPWISVFPLDRFMFIRTEDYKTRPSAHVSIVAEFLGMRNVTESKLKKAASMEKRNEKRYSKMKEETRVALQAFYRPFNQRLMEILGRDSRWLWGY